MAQSSSDPGNEPASDPQIVPFKAVYLDSEGSISIRSISDLYKPELPSQFLIRVEYSAINPGDLRHFHMGLHSFVMGYDYVGTVVSTHPDSSSDFPFKKGDAVMGMTFPGHARPISHGAHQAYLLADLSHNLTFHRPKSFPAIEAVGFTSPVQTAADAIFNILGIGLPSADLDGDDPSEKALLIWGGASALGWASIQLAKAAGFKCIFTTASRKSHAALREIRNSAKKQGIILSLAFDTVCKGTGIFEPPVGAEEGNPKQLVDFAKSTPSLTKSALSEGVVERGEAKLASSLPILQDSEFLFVLFSRKWAGEEGKHPGWWQRQEKVVSWVSENHEAVWKPMPVKVVDNAEESVKAIQAVFDGKYSLLKVLLKHPLT
ncbi:GroES-like protein [Rhypophila decipiens]|uniref:GroES-like protein n=1 Tax=Rhypophila decipiens TaxID=261697 RepID=A0AAN6YCX7_9PEZI|nr:GroES-like protein [Rhypophila decipiens]